MTSSPGVRGSATWFAMVRPETGRAIDGRAMASGHSPSDQSPQAALAVSPWSSENPMLDKMSWCVLSLLLVSLGARGPNEPLRLITPALLSAPIMLVDFVAMLIVCGFRVGSAVTLGFLIGSLGYDMTLYYLRHGMPEVLGRALRRHHMLPLSRIPNAGSA
jgi:hypothetical protein